MELTFTRQLPLPVAQVVALMCDEQLQAAKAARLDATAFACTVTDEEDGGRTVRTQRALETVGLPEFVRALVRPVMVVHETERWAPPGADEARGGAFELDVDGAPMRLRGTVGVEPAPGGSRLTFTGVLTSTVPLFRARIEEASAELVRRTMEIECTLLAERAAADPAPQTPVGTSTSASRSRARHSS